MSVNKKLHIIVNPASGAKQAEKVYEEEVMPFVGLHGSEYEKIVHTTTAEGDATNVARTIMNSEEEGLTFILLGGDGTTHEVLNGLVTEESNDRSVKKDVRIAIVPTGTANALYASLYAKQKGPSFAHDKMSSVHSLFMSTERVPLALSAVRTSDGKETLAHLITSHALHASILADSEAFRNEFPGIERFKMAFQQNMNVWVHASIELTPWPGAGHVQRYDPKKGAFVNVEDLLGPIDDLIAYFVCVTTDRLEPAFVPAPFSGPSCDVEGLQRPKDAVDVVLFRPLRNPALATKFGGRGADFWTGKESEDVRTKIGETQLMQISKLMYHEGRHVHLTYTQDGELEEDGHGPTVCEYYRCAGYSWTPKESKARRTCIDGTVVESDRTSVRVLKEKEGAGRIVACL